MAFPPSSSHDWSRCNNIISISGHSILLIINRELISRIWPYAFRLPAPLPHLACSTDHSPRAPYATLLRHRVTLGSSRTSGYTECLENTYSRNLRPPPRLSICIHTHTHIYIYIYIYICICTYICIQYMYILHRCTPRIRHDIASCDIISVSGIRDQRYKAESR